VGALGVAPLNALRVACLALHMSLASLWAAGA